MDTHVPAIETGEDPAASLEDLPSHPGIPENSDVTLFKQRIGHSKSALYAGIPATELETDSEQTKVLESLSHKFKALLGTETEEANLPSQSSPTGKNKELANSVSDKTGAHADLIAPKETTAGKFASTSEIIKGKFVNEKVDSVSDLTQDGTALPITHVPLVAETSTIQSANRIGTHAAMISQQIKEQVIDRILVSTNDIAADKTVKVIINPTVLEGTEVNFQKVGSMLSVQFASRNEGSLQFLQANQADLQGYLQGELKQFKGVSVTIKSSGNNAEHPEDGRSRNRYEYQTLDEDEQ